MRNRLMWLLIASCVVALAGCGSDGSESASIEMSSAPSSFAEPPLTDFTPTSVDPCAAQLQSTWGSRPSGGIQVNLAGQSAGAVTVTVSLDGSRTEVQDRTLDDGQTNPQFDFPAVESAAVQSVTAQSSAGSCPVSGSP